MSKSRIPLFIFVAALFLVILLELQTIAHLRSEVAALTQENGRLQQSFLAQEKASPSSTPQVGSQEVEQMPQLQQQRLAGLQSEVMRLRGAAGRALRAEAEVVQLKSALQGHPLPAAPGAADANSSSNLFSAYFGEAVPPPANIDAPYTREGLLTAVQEAARLAGVPLKKVQIDTSEFPFLAGAVCDNDEDFEKMKAQFKKMPSYEYGGATSSHGTYAFNITPFRSYPSEAREPIGRRMPLRMQMFFNQLNAQ